MKGSILLVEGGAKVTRAELEEAGFEVDVLEESPASADAVAGTRSDAVLIAAPVLDRLLQRALRERDRLTALTSEVSISLARGGRLRPMLQGACEALVRHLDAAFARIWTLDEQRKTLLLQASAGMYTHIDGGHAAVPVGKFKIGLIAQERLPHRTNDVLRDPRVGDKAWAAREGLVAFAGHPLIAGDEVVGVLAMFSRHPVDQLTSNALASIAGSLAVAVQSSHAREALERSQSQLRQSQKMEEIGRLAGGVAHDFNNLLTVISGHAEFIKSEEAATEQILRDVEMISSAADKAAALTRQLLAFSRKQILQPKVLNLNALVSETQKMLRRLIGEDIAMAVELAPDLHTIRADAGQMDQVIVNLAVNARDAMADGGTLGIQTANVELTEPRSGLEPGSYARLSVSDTGCGMDAETREKIFEPFFTTKLQGHGTGLGLATVQGIVLQTGGAIEVQSEPGKGTRFDVYFPRSTGVDSPAAPPRPVAQSCRQETVLVVDDEEDVRMLFRRVLERRGCKVLDAANGQAALEICRSHPGEIQLLVTDVVMPVLSGASLAKELTALRPATRVLFVSGYTQDSLGRHGVLDPSVHLLHKPVAPDELWRKVREVLDA